MDKWGNRARGNVRRGDDGVGIFERSGHAACGGDVVFFNENAVVQPDAMVHTATDDDGVFLRQTQAGNGFARVNDVGFRACDGFNVGINRGGCAREQLQKVQSGALGGHQRTR